jgi:CDGSH-type Zn-finger protein
MSRPKRPPRITPLADGPLRYERRVDDGPVGGLHDASGCAIEGDETVLLCRCGHSATKPVCDFTHSRVGFDSSRRTSGRLDRRVDYQGEEVTIHDNRQVCAHVEFCVEDLPDVFDRESAPWIDPDGASSEEIAELVKRCPSGALSVTIGDRERRDHDRPPKVSAQSDGPYFVEGWVEVEDSPRGEGVSEEHCTLCRCGASRNKPFCDGKHWRTDFHDPDGGERDPDGGDGSAGTPLRVHDPDGPRHS